jgi:hypothetical protein
MRNDAHSSAYYYVGHVLVSIYYWRVGVFVAVYIINCCMLHRYVLHWYVLHRYVLPSLRVAIAIITCIVFLCFFVPPLYTKGDAKHSMEWILANKWVMHGCNGDNGCNIGCCNTCCRTTTRGATMVAMMGATMGTKLGTTMGTTRLQQHVQRWVQQCVRIALLPNDNNVS